MDDFALRKGHVYGTVLVDIGMGDAVDLLPDREAATVESWLKTHPGMKASPTPPHCTPNCGNAAGPAA